MARTIAAISPSLSPPSLVDWPIDPESVGAIVIEPGSESKTYYKLELIPLLPCVWE